MAETVLVIGKSGSGKSHSIQYLDPSETFIIAVRPKSLPWRGWKKKYEQKTGGNYYVAANYANIIKVMREVAKRPNIKQIIIDDLQYIMSTEFMDRASEVGFTKFTEIAKHIWQIFNAAEALPGDELKVFMLAHDEVNDSGERKMKTIGKLLDDKITVEGLFSIVLFTEIDRSGAESKYQFVTQSNGTNTAKSPDGMFDKYIPNNLQLVSDKINEYNEGE